MEDYLLVNFGGPRSHSEIAPFLTELLCDRDVIRTPLPSYLHNWIFSNIARKRAKKIRHDYDLIGGKSPIFFDTEELAARISEKFAKPILTFHRYLPDTHEESLSKITASNASTIRVLPLFPQFTYATTGSIARFFSKKLPSTTLEKLKWIRSYPTHLAFVSSYQKKIQNFLSLHNLAEQETILLFSSHGVPKKYIDKGDSYQNECEKSYFAIMAAFPQILSRLSYQSKFGPGEWIRPYTNEVCSDILSWNQGRKQVVFVPLSFPSDHIETLFEIEYQYLPLIREKGLLAYRCPALNLEPYWIEGIANLFLESPTVKNQYLIRWR